MKKVLVIGGGLVGSLLSANLSRHGYKVKLYERRPDVRGIELQAGKSINLALSTRGWKAVDLIGLREKIEKISIPMYGRMVHDEEGNKSLQPYGKEGQAIYSVSRGELNVCLLDKAEKEYDVEMNFDWRCVHVDFETTTAEFEHTETGEKRKETADLIFGTDGAFSQVRANMQLTRRFDYQQEFIPHGYRELLMPANADGSHKIEKNALHIWPRGGYMLIALPNLDGSYTCTLFMPYEGKDSFAALEDDEKVKRFFTEVFPDFTEMMPDIIKNYREHQLADLVIIRCYPWVNKNTAILGDASHAIVPFYGQGMNSGFEDVSVMDELIEKHNHDWEKILPEFQQLRKPDADAIATLAMRNYVEMRDLVADPGFVLRKKIEGKIYRKHPEQWMPLYSQVTFSHTRYSQALKTGMIQDRIMEEVMKRPDIESTWDSAEVEEAILEKLKALK
ncbi:FAD-dependent monooxygenase [Cryomorpha ignava]|uniref:Kynurenine 3-monooxygenase n=1 Tax=Cryomorpha ignava TaxID=101383 RepID=A0A7K3WNT3_9FLAO|nr:NAD(P)/FAD-dependent oxidoreductase [Cryomorpha ignava]NEN23319.1 FAD-dependent monooxygenase [Cryomorpha ignava]